MSVKCPKCQKPVQQGASFCGNCGTKIANPEPIPQNSAMEFYQFREYQKERRTKKIHQKIEPRQLSQLIRDFESKNSQRHLQAKRVLIEKKPLEAVKPLWKIGDKIFVSDSLKEAVFEVLGEIGSDPVIDIILDKFIIWDIDKQIWALNVLFDELSPRTVEWLSERCVYVDAPLGIIALEIIRRIGSKEAIKFLAKNARGNFTEDLAPNVGKSLLLNLAIAGAVAAKQASNRNMAASLITAPFIPIELLPETPKLVQVGQALTYRVQVMAELVQKKGGKPELDRIFNQNFINSVAKLERITVESIIASTYLVLGSDHPLLGSSIKKIIGNPRKIQFSDKLSAAIVVDSIIRYSKQKKTDIHDKAIAFAIKDKDKIASQSAMSSVLYQNYLPFIGEVLQKISVQDNRFTPALAFCGYFHGNSECKILLDRLSKTGSKDVKYAINNWREIITEWKKF